MMTLTPFWRSGLLFTLATLGGLASAQTGQHPTAQVRIEAPADGATLSSPFTVRFGVRGMAVRPAGDMTDGTGHHHLLIDEGPITAGTAIPMTEKHLHFGKGQTETQLTLPPGTYRLTTQFGNGVHQSYGPPLSHSIRITIQ